MNSDTSYLSKQGIERLLTPEVRNQVTLEVFDSITSTNDVLKSQAAEGAQQYTVVAANAQSAGRGRRGKSFFSPKGCGVYLSILTWVDTNLFEPSLLTALACVAGKRAIQKYTRADIRVKWPNDIYIDGMKACGILVESKLGASNDKSWVVTGIGINVYEPKDGYPPEVTQKVTCVSNTLIPDLHNDIAAGFIEEYIHMFEDSPNAYKEEYRSASYLNGKAIVIDYDGTDSIEAEALCVNDDLSLRVRLEDGRLENIYAGNVSVHQT